MYQDGARRSQPVTGGGYQRLRRPAALRRRRLRPPSGVPKLSQPPRPARIPTEPHARPRPSGSLSRTRNGPTRNDSLIRVLNVMTVPLPSTTKVMPAFSGGGRGQAVA